LQGIELIIVKKKSINQTFNLTYGKACKIKTLAKTVQSYFPSVKIKFKKRDKLIPLRGTLDISKAVKLLGYKPNYDAKKGFDKYIKWYKELNEFKK
jgi:nucleoside-diphosphate-sugar epimerase